MHSAKALPSVTLGISHSPKNLLAKPSLPSAIYRALGKAFAVCYEALGKKKGCDGGKTITETLPSAKTAGTRQTFSFF
jgi:hypothetical protein